MSVDGRTRRARAVAGLGVVALLAVTGCADYVGDDLRAGTATVPGADGPTDLAGAPPTTLPPPDPEAVAVTDLGPGDCFVGLEGFVPGGTVGRLPCTVAHEAELVAVVDLADLGATWPGVAAVAEAADAACLAGFETYVGTDWATSALDYAVVAPSPLDWVNATTEVRCAGFDLGREPLSGSVAGSGR